MDAWRYEIYLLVFTFDISLVRYRCEHSKINSISPRAHILFSICIRILFFYKLAGEGWSYEVKFPNVYSKGGRWDFRFCGFGQLLVSCMVCGFSPISSLVFGFNFV